MELLTFKEKILELFDTDMEGLGDALKNAYLNHDENLFDGFVDLVGGDLSEDWLQKIFQYYHADRKEKMQDYTPKSLARFLGVLAGEADDIIDMCAGSGALAIQRWNQNKDQKFITYELDEKVIPYLIFNLAVRNIEALVSVGDILQGEMLEVWNVRKGEKYGHVSRLESSL